MKTIVKRVGGGPVKFEDFATKHGLVLEVNERSPTRTGGTRAHYWAKFQGVGISDGAFEIGVYGNGLTPEAAIADYAPKILSQTLRIGYPNPGEVRYVETPTEWIS